MSATKTEMISGTVESISKTSIIVSVNGKTATLTGKAAEKMAKDVKLGDVIQFDALVDPSQVIWPTVKKTAAAAPRSGSNSPSREVSASQRY